MDDGETQTDTVVDPGAATMDETLEDPLGHRLGHTVPVVDHLTAVGATVDTTDHLDVRPPVLLGVGQEVAQDLAGPEPVGPDESGLAVPVKLRTGANHRLHHLTHHLTDGNVVEVEVEGWGKPAYLHPEASLPRRASGTALLSPFDNLIWYRDRVERIWDFHYRIEIYVPEPKRVYGYYVLPFLLDGDLVARVDLKTNRQGNTLLVRGAFAEPDVDKTRVGRELRKELESVANWLGLEDLEIARNGNLHQYL